MKEKQEWEPGFAYLVARDTSDVWRNRQELLDGHDRQLCKLMESEVGNGPYDRDGWRRFPWLTLVLGSGCLTIEGDPVAGAEALSRGATVHIDDNKIEAGKEWGSSFLSHFIQTLYRDRVPASRLPRQSATESVSTGGPMEVTEFAARLAFLAARLTRFYHLSSAASVQATGRWHNDVTMYDRDCPGPFTKEIEPTVISPVMEDLDYLLHRCDENVGDEPAVGGLVRSLLRCISDGFVTSKRCTLRHIHLRTVTEVAWHYLTKNTDIYPGWTDLLYHLLMRSTHCARRDESLTKTRPLYEELHSVTEDIAKIFRNATRASFSARDHKDAPTARQEFYDTVAQLLDCQASAVAEQADAVVSDRESVDVGVKLPPATAFITSFDVELEMALWCAGVSFSVVLPVHVQREQEPKAALVWLMADIEPDPTVTWERQLECLLQEPKAWNVVTSRPLDENHQKRPIIVRLSGCPLFGLPEIKEVSEGLERLVGVTEGVQLHHAVTIDEYSALQQSRAEQFSSGRDERDSEGRQSRALPDELTGNSSSNPRYWMTLGVQVPDPAIRYRLFSQLSLVGCRRRSTSKIEHPEMWGEVAAHVSTEELADSDNGPIGDFTAFGGLAVNRRIDDDEATLLYWLGFDVVRDDCFAFIKDFEHYADHVKKRGSRPPVRGRCPLGS